MGMRIFFLLLLAGAAVIVCKTFDCAERKPAGDTSEAISNLTSAIKEQPQVKEIIKNVENRGDRIVKSLEATAKEYSLDVPAAAIVLGAKVVVEKKIEISGKTPLIENKYKVSIRPDEYSVSLEGETFIKSMMYGISSGNKVPVSLNLKMDF